LLAVTDRSDRRGRVRGRHHSRTFIICLLLKLHGCGDPIPHIPSPSHPLQVLSTTPLTLHPDSPTFCSVLLVFSVLIQLHGCGDILFHIQALPGSVSGALPGMTGRQAADDFARCSECLSTCTHGSQHKAFRVDKGAVGFGRGGHCRRGMVGGQGQAAKYLAAAVNASAPVNIAADAT
jgi:uncharacterized protein YceK